MLLPDSPFRTSTDDAVATLWLDCETLAPARVRQLAEIAEAVAARPAVEVLVIRSGYPGGFPSFDHLALRDLDSDEAAADYARVGQLALRKLANLPIPTVAFLEGPCVGPGLELALACDYRLAVATPDAVLGLGDLPTAWGGRSRLARRIGRRTAARFVSCYPREAAKLGLVDDAFCQRRAKIELRRHLDRLQCRPVKRAVPTDVIAEAVERRTFRAAVRDGLAIPEKSPAFEPSNPIAARPRRVGVIGTSAAAVRWAGEFALRGVPVIWLRTTTADPFAAAVTSGRVTPLEAEQATARTAVVTRLDDALTADLVVIDETDDTGAAFLERVMPARSVLLLPSGHLDGVLPSCARPARVLGWETADGLLGLVTHPDTVDDAVAAAVLWLRLAGASVDVRQAVAVAEPATPRRSLSVA